MNNFYRRERVIVNLTREEIYDRLNPHNLILEARDTDRPFNDDGYLVPIQTFIGNSEVSIYDSFLVMVSEVEACYKEYSRFRLIPTRIYYRPLDNNGIYHFETVDNEKEIIGIQDFDTDSFLNADMTFQERCKKIPRKIVYHFHCRFGIDYVLPGDLQTKKKTDYLKETQEIVRQYE